MTVSTTHTTTYLYSDPVSICHTEVHLAPRDCPHQRLISHELSVTPNPAFRVSRRDYFGNEITIFTIQEPHQTLNITMTRARPPSRPPWPRSSPSAAASVRISRI